MKSVGAALGLVERGDLAGAEKLLTEILAQNGDDADAAHLMATVQHAKGDIQRAATFFDRAHALSPYDADIAFNRMVILFTLARHKEYLDACAGFLKLRPGDPEALMMQGASLAAIGQHEAALASLDLSYEHRADVHARRAASLLQLGRTEEALHAAARASGIDPRNADAHYHRGQAFGVLELWPEAVEALDAARTLAPNNLSIRAARAPALANVGRFDEALADIDAALTRFPDRPEYLARRGYILSAANRAAEALAAYDRVLAKTPNDPSAIYAKSDLLLGGGDFARGLRLYEIRHRTERRFTPVSSAPLWRGEALEGKSILVQGEQGFGDLFQFCRFISDLAARGARVILQERAQTLRLMQSVEGLSESVPANQPAPSADFHIPLASLMLALKLGVNDIPAPVPYLGAESERVDAWRTALGAGSKRRIGVAWSGVTRHAMQRWRSLDKASLGALLSIDVDFVSLQMEESDVAAAHDVRQFGKEIGDFADLAALIETLDAVVSIDTGVAHLAGALGKPVYLMLPFRADWRWLRDRADTPWYPNMRLFRQPHFGDWQSVIADVHAALQE